jgi:hypothetical protein
MAVDPEPANCPRAEAKCWEEIHSRKELTDIYIEPNMRKKSSPLPKEH